MNDALIRLYREECRHYLMRAEETRRDIAWREEAAQGIAELQAEADGYLAIARTLALQANDLERAQDDEDGHDPTTADPS